MKETLVDLTSVSKGFASLSPVNSAQISIDPSISRSPIRIVACNLSIGTASMRGWSFSTGRDAIGGRLTENPGDPTILPASCVIEALVLARGTVFHFCHASPSAAPNEICS